MGSNKEAILAVLATGPKTMHEVRIATHATVEVMKHLVETGDVIRIERGAHYYALPGWHTCEGCAGSGFQGPKDTIKRPAKKGA